MAAVSVVPFKAEHVELLSLRELERETLVRFGGVSDYAKVLDGASKVAGTFMCDGRVITCAGFLELWSGVAEVWQLPSSYIAERPLLYARTIKRYLEQITDTFGYRRLQTTAVVDDLHSRWMTWLGFQKEGTLRNYDNLGRDYNQYARLFK